MSQQEEQKSKLDDILEQIKAERLRQKELELAQLDFHGDLDMFDRMNSRNDWIAYITKYAGDAAEKVVRNIKAGFNFRTQMIKVAALAIAAIESHDDGHC